MLAGGTEPAMSKTVPARLQCYLGKSSDGGLEFFVIIVEITEVAPTGSKACRHLKSNTIRRRIL